MTLSGGEYPMMPRSEPNIVATFRKRAAECRNGQLGDEKPWTWEVMASWLDEAADEMERLRAAIEELTA